jgi:hypothetical protein
LTGKAQINVKVTNSIRDMAILGAGLGADGFSLPSPPFSAVVAARRERHHPVLASFANVERVIRQEVIARHSKACRSAAGINKRS